MEQEAEQSMAAPEKKSADPRMSGLWRPLAWVGAVVLVLIVIGAVSASMWHIRRSTVVFDRSYTAMPFGSRMMGGYGGYGMMGTGRYGASANQQRLSGVVTVVNGSTLTIAGGGTTNTVQTDSNTQYLNDKKPAVNDTVTVLGTTNNGTFTASEVAVQ